MKQCKLCQRTNIDDKPNEVQLHTDYTCTNCGHEWREQMKCVQIMVRMSVSQYNRMFWAIHTEQKALTELGDKEGAAELDAVIENLKEKKLLKNGV